MAYEVGEKVSQQVGPLNVYQVVKHQGLDLIEFNMAQLAQQQSNTAKANQESSDSEDSLAVAASRNKVKRRVEDEGGYGDFVNDYEDADDRGAGEDVEAAVLDDY